MGNTELEVGDLVFVITANFKGFNKLKEKFIGPSKIVEKLSNISYRIELPVKYQVHNVFHSSLLSSSYENDSVMSLVELLSMFNLQL